MNPKKLKTISHSMRNLKTFCLFMLAAILLCTAGCGSTEPKQENSNGAQQVSNDGEGDNSASGEEEPYGELEEGDTAPEFSAPLAGGGTFTLSEQKGKVVLLNFWATWCGPCVKEMPAFERLKEDYGDDVAVLAVNSMEDESTVDQFIKEKGYTFPIAYDTEGEIGEKYPTDGIPYTLVIDAEGSIRNIFLGAYDADAQYEEYKKAIEAARK